MRRRAVSHNPNRLPRRLRRSHNAVKAKSEAGSNSAKKPKRPSRKYRRRPSNLLSEYNRRQRKHAWLETHVWHAKRFHMADRWGWRVPDRPTDKAFRACFRAARDKCLMRDISYYACVQLEGPTREQLIDGLRKMTLAETGSFEDCMDGLTEGRAYVYHAGKAPKEVIDEVTFMWRKQTDSSSPAMLWIFCHPACHEEFKEELITVFECGRHDEAVVEPPAKR